MIFYHSCHLAHGRLDKGGLPNLRQFPQIYYIEKKSRPRSSGAIPEWPISFVKSDFAERIPSYSFAMRNVDNHKVSSRTALPATIVFFVGHYYEIAFFSDKSSPE